MEFKRRSKLKTTPNLQILNGGKVAPSHRLPRRHCLRHRGWRAKKICTQKLAITPPPRPRRWQGISLFPPFMGSRGLVPLRGVGQRSTSSWRKQEARCARARVHDPAKAKAVAKEYHISPFHGVKGTCSLAGSGAAPHELLAKTRGEVVAMTPSLSTATASLKSTMLTLAPHERVGGKGGDVIFRMIVQRLQGTKGLLILDEAQHLLLPR